VEYFIHYSYRKGVAVNFSCVLKRKRVVCFHVDFLVSAASFTIAHLHSFRDEIAHWASVLNKGQERLLLQHCQAPVVGATKRDFAFMELKVRQSAESEGEFHALSLSTRKTFCTSYILLGQAWVPNRPPYLELSSFHRHYSHECHFQDVNNFSYLFHRYIRTNTILGHPILCIYFNKQTEFIIFRPDLNLSTFEGQQAHSPPAPPACREEMRLKSFLGEGIAVWAPSAAILSTLNVSHF
jgi:hypothetical protein